MSLVLKTVSFQATSMGAAAETFFDESGGTFGRGDSCTWVLPDPSRYISGTHGRVFCEDGRFFVEDRSTNGLIIEGQASPIGKGSSDTASCVYIASGSS
jgi:predicted component of type VI protein secretion system